jgi:hypothetical protein
MTFQEQIKALPEAERIKFFRAIMAVVDAGYAAGVPPKEWANLYADVYRGVNDLIEESKK